MPLHLKESNSNRLVLLVGHETPSRYTSSLYDAYIQWNRRTQQSQHNNNKNNNNENLNHNTQNTNKTKVKLASLKDVFGRNNNTATMTLNKNKSNSVITTTRVYLDGELNAQVKCACPQLNQCRASSRSKNADSTQIHHGNNCSLYMVGFMSCSAYRICLEVVVVNSKNDDNRSSSNHDTPTATKELMCGDLRVPCTKMVLGVPKKESGALITLLTVIFVCVALILFFMMILRCNLF